MNFEFKNEATRATLKANKRLLNGGHFGIRCIACFSLVMIIVDNNKKIKIKLISFGMYISAKGM